MRRSFEFFYRLFLTLVINFTVINVSIDALGNRLSTIHLILILVSTLISIFILFVFDRKPIIFVILIILGMINLIIVNKYYDEVLIVHITKFNNFILWLIKYINYEISVDNSYFNYFLILFTILLSLFMYIIVFKFRKIYPILLLGTAFFLYRWFWNQDSALTHYYIFILCILLLHLLNIYRNNIIRWKIDKRDYANYNSKNLFIYSILVSTIIISVVFILPKDNPPITWRWMDNKIQNIFPQVTEWRNSLKKSQKYGKSLKFNLSFTPYQDNPKRLGGDIEIDDVLVMEVESKSPLYLKGRVSSEYTGFSWKNEKNDVTEYIKSSSIAIKEENINNYRELTYNIKYKNLTTSTIFNSYIPVDIDYKERYYVSDEYEIYTNEVILKEKWYKVKSIIPYLDNSKLDEEYGKEDKFKKYLQLSDSVSKDTHSLALDIIENATNDYEKMINLQNYLRDNYEYTLTPGDNEYKYDFVDDFLFNKEKGYCTYFASALAVMGRSVNIPTRYVEGFITGEELEDGKYKVYSKNAHAWVEAYINGYGWMTFEATPAYKRPEYQEKESSRDYIYEEVEDNDNESNDSAVEQRMKEELLDEFFLEKETRLNNINNGKDYESDSLNIVTIIILIIFIILIYILYKIYIRSIINLRIKKLRGREKIRVCYFRIVKLLSILGYKKESGETDIEFMTRVYLRQELNNELIKFLNIYIRTIYGNKDLSVNDENQGIKLIKFLEEEVKKEKGTLKLILYKYIMNNGEIK